jgi:hypothetical protein
MPFFRRKLAKLEENCDHNVGPWNIQLRRVKNFGPAEVSYSSSFWLYDQQQKKQEEQKKKKSCENFFSRFGQIQASIGLDGALVRLFTW